MNRKGGGPKSAAFSVWPPFPFGRLFRLAAFCIWPPFAFGGPILTRTLTPGRSQG
jgi:hypothetical protein